MVRWNIHRKTSRDNGRVLVEFGMTPYILQHRQNFQILEEAFGDLLRRIARKVIETKDFCLTGCGKFPIQKQPS